MYTENKYNLKVTTKIKISLSRIMFFVKAVTDQLENRPIFRAQYQTQLLFAICCLGFLNHWAKEAQ